jgi:hypothetical protein
VVFVWPCILVADELARLLARLGVKGRPDQRGQHRLLLAALSAARDSRALVRVGDDELHASEPALVCRRQRVRRRQRLAQPHFITVIAGVCAVRSQAT